jgi:hypothetical protein
VLPPERVGGEEVVPQHRPQLAAEPVADGDGEAHLLPPEHPRRQAVRERLAEHALGAALEELVARESRGKLHQLVIHEGAADFEAVEHRGAVCFGEQVAGEVVTAVDRQRGAYRPDLGGQVLVPGFERRSEAALGRAGVTSCSWFR